MSNIRGGNKVEHSLEISWNEHVQHLKKENSIEKILNIIASSHCWLNMQHGIK